MSGLFLSLREGAQLTREQPDRLTLQYGTFTKPLSDPCAATMDALLRLANGGDDEDRLSDAVAESGDVDALARFQYLLHALGAWQLLSRSVRQGECRLATLTGISPYFIYSPRSLEPHARYLLSRFAHARVHDGDYVLESPLSHARVTLHDSRAAALLHALARPASAADLAGARSDLEPATTSQLGSLLLTAGMLTEEHNDGRTLEDDDRALCSWEFHDLLFHARSRAGRHDGSIGGTYRFAGAFGPPPAIKPAAGGATIALERPAAGAPEHDLSFAAVQQARRSIRRYGAQPVTRASLGEFLYRVGRVTDIGELDVSTPAVPLKMEFARRPYPGGGAMYELEFYAVANRCDGLEAGLYHYDARHHRLEPVCGRTANVNALLAGASRGTGIPPDDLQVLLVLTSRFQRMSWKYSSIAYAATLKHVGVVFQTMYLVATAMRLAPCAVGCGDSDLFARAASIEYYAETSVGEFLLGSRPDSE